MKIFLMVSLATLSSSGFTRPINLANKMSDLMNEVNNLANKMSDLIACPDLSGNEVNK